MEPGRLIRDLRRRQGVSQQSLAIRAGTSQAAISDIERGKVSPAFETVERLLLCLGHRLHAEARPIEMDADPTLLMESLRLEAEDRVAKGVAMANLSDRLREAGR